MLEIPPMNWWIMIQNKVIEELIYVISTSTGFERLTDNLVMEE
jgi:hypothetical protein